mgnify:CR=1 FL=1
MAPHTPAGASSSAAASAVQKRRRQWTRRVSVAARGRGGRRGGRPDLVSRVKRRVYLIPVPRGGNWENLREARDTWLTDSWGRQTTTGATVSTGQHAGGTALDRPWGVDVSWGGSRGGRAPTEDAGWPRQRARARPSPAGCRHAKQQGGKGKVGRRRGKTGQEKRPPLKRKVAYNTRGRPAPPYGASLASERRQGETKKQTQETSKKPNIEAKRKRGRRAIEEAGNNVFIRSRAATSTPPAQWHLPRRRG